MKIGRIKYYLFFFTFFFSICLAEDRIISSPLINVDELKPSFEEEDKIDENIDDSNVIFKKKGEGIIDANISSVKLMGLDKITAKTSEIKIKLGDTKKFGLLEIKALKCGKSIKDETGDVAYIQVKDISENQNEKVFIFNGWTFSSNPSITPIDHAVYDIWLVSCQSA